jgi:hypothetical protein
MEAEVNSLNVSLERSLNDIAVAFEVGARSGEAVPLNLHSQIRNVHQLGKTHFFGHRNGRRIEDRSINLTG